MLYVIFVGHSTTHMDTSYKTKNTMKNTTHIISTFSILFALNFSFGQINLGTASNFALFTAAGEFENVGNSYIIGDIGTNVGVILGFPPGQLTGQIHEEDSVSTQAAIDVENAYSDLTDVLCDSLLGDGLGLNQTLKPNMYCILTATTLNGDLILDGENNSDALFIIKIDGVLDVIAHSRVILTNSTKVSNVYWQINGALNVGDSVVFEGIVLANGAINFAEGSVLNGNGLSRQGAISTINMTATIPSSFALPAKLIDFEGVNMETYILYLGQL
jgi:hypothetical protein